MAKEELDECTSALEALENSILHTLVPKDSADSKNVIIEVRPGFPSISESNSKGTGGKEASLFTSDVFKMYQAYSELKGWKFELLYFTDTDVGGCKVLFILIDLMKRKLVLLFQEKVCMEL